MSHITASTKPEQFLLDLNRTLHVLCKGLSDFNSDVKITGYLNICVDKQTTLDFIIKENLDCSTYDSLSVESKSFVAADRNSPKKTQATTGCSKISSTERPQNNDKRDASIQCHLIKAENNTLCHSTDRIVYYRFREQKMRVQNSVSNTDSNALFDEPLLIDHSSAINSELGDAIHDSFGENHQPKINDKTEYENNSLQTQRTSEYQLNHIFSDSNHKAAQKSKPMNNVRSSSVVKDCGSSLNNSNQYKDKVHLKCKVRLSKSDTSSPVFQKKSYTNVRCVLLVLPKSVV